MLNFNNAKIEPITSIKKKKKKKKRTIIKKKRRRFDISNETARNSHEKWHGEFFDI